MQRVLKKPTAELHPIAVNQKVWSLVGMDLVGPLQKTAKGNQYILTMSKWVDAMPLANKSAFCVVQAIFSVYCWHGAPNNIITDQGREFIKHVGFY